MFTNLSILSLCILNSSFIMQTVRLLFIDKVL